MDANEPGWIPVAPLQTPGQQAAVELVLDCFIAALARHHGGLVPDVMSLLASSVRGTQQALPQEQHQEFDDAIRSLGRRMQRADQGPARR